MGLILPRSHTIHGRGPKFACTLCEAVFTEDERGKYERHVTGHALEEVQARSLAHQAPGIFSDEGGDEEWGAWVAKHREIDPEGREWHRWGKTGDGKNSSGIGDG